MFDFSDRRPVYWRNELPLPAFTRLRVAVNHRKTFWYLIIRGRAVLLASQIYRIFRQMAVFLGSAIADVEIHVMVFLCHCTRYKARMCTKVCSCRNIVGALGYPKVGKCSRRSRARHLQNRADGKLLDRRSSYCAVVLRMTLQAYRRKN